MSKLIVFIVLALAVAVSAQSWIKSSDSVNGVAFEAREVTHAFTLPDDLLYIVSGGDASISSNIYNDVRSSTTGFEWSTPSVEGLDEYGYTPFKRIGAAVVATGKLNQLFVIGGVDTSVGLASSFKNTVWQYNSDNTLFLSSSWTLTAANPDFSPRQYAAASFVSNTLVLTGGLVLDSGLNFIVINEVWFSTDNGATWSQRAAPVFSARYGHATAVSGSVLVLTGGYKAFQSNPSSGVYLTSNAGVSWTALTNAPFTPRVFHSMAFFNGAIWAAGGRISNSTSLPAVVLVNDVWKSTNDGASWTKDASSDNSFTPRDHLQFVATSNKLYAIGGSVPAGVDATASTGESTVGTNDVYVWSSALPNTYSWSLAGYASCLDASSASCCLAGGNCNGQQQPAFVCLNDAGDEVADTFCTGPYPVVSPLTCTLPACPPSSSYTRLWVGNVQPDVCLKGGRDCYVFGTSDQGTLVQEFTCTRNSDGALVSDSSFCKNLVAANVPAPDACTLTKVCVVGIEWRAYDWDTTCIGSVAGDNLGAFCQYGNLTTTGSFAAKFRCFQNGYPTSNSVCTSANLTFPTDQDEACTLLPCIPGAFYQVIGIGACVNSVDLSTCCNSTSCPAIAPYLYQCVTPDDQQGVPGQCIDARPTHSKPCILPTCGSHIKGDPEFVGFRGQKFEVHGVPGSIFNIISSASLQYNAEFVFLGSKSDRACNTTRTHPWTHPGTYLGRLGFQIGTDRVYVEAGDCLTGIVNVTVNSEQLSVGDKFHFGGKHSKQVLEFVDDFTLQFHLTEVEVEIQNSDNFFNQVVSLTRVGERTSTMHGLLGQTWSNKIYRDEHGRKHFIQGHPNDYLIQDDDLFGTDFIYNVFQQQ